MGQYNKFTFRQGIEPEGDPVPVAEKANFVLVGHRSTVSATADGELAAGPGPFPLGGGVGGDGVGEISVWTDITRVLPPQL